MWADGNGAPAARTRRHCAARVTARPQSTQLKRHGRSRRHGRRREHQQATKRATKTSVRLRMSGVATRRPLYPSDEVFFGFLEAVEPDVSEGFFEAAAPDVSDAFFEAAPEVSDAFLSASAAFLYEALR